MGSLIGSIVLMSALGTTGGIFFNRDPNNHVLPPQPGYGVGYRNGNSDNYGYVEVGDKLPLGADRTPDYFFRRYTAVPAEQLFMPNYYNPYISRGQRFLPFAACGGSHPMSGPPRASAMSTIHPYTETLNETPRSPPSPSFNGRVEATRRSIPARPAFRP